jgi:translation initiation factor IF-1
LQLADQSRVLAHVSSRREKDFLRLLPGDEVQVRLSPRDRGRARIVKRCEP